MPIPPKQSLFWEIHSGLPREGPGDDVSTRMAFSMVAGLPRAPRILDVGCGPGMQTLELARLSDGDITAVDLHQPFLDDLRRRARAAGVESRVTPLNASMAALPFEPGSFDLIWCEGAIYFLGFEEGLARWRPLLADGGHVVVTEPCWLKPNPPRALRAFWEEYPGMMTLDQALAAADRAGYETVGHFTLPDAAWWDDYYMPMVARVSALEQKYAGDAAVLAELAAARAEPDTHRLCDDYYGYVFFIIRKTA